MIINGHLCSVFFILAASLLAETRIPPPECLPLKCFIKCPYGQQTDSYGCPICSCRPKPECPLLKCATNCPYGYQEVNGCRTCVCKPAPYECPVSNCLFIKCLGLQTHVDKNGCKFCTCGKVPYLA